jgi:hypothetical protein
MFRVKKTRRDSTSSASPRGVQQRVDRIVKELSA